MLALLLVALLLIAMVSRPLRRWRARRQAAAAGRRDSFHEFLAQVERARAQRQAETTEDQIPW